MRAVAAPNFSASSLRRSDCSPSFGVVFEFVRLRTVRGGSLHHSCLLVYSFDLFREPCGYARAGRDQYFFWNRPVDAPGFIAAQLVGAFAATAVFRWLVPSLQAEATSVLVPHEETADKRYGT